MCLAVDMVDVDALSDRRVRLERLRDQLADAIGSCSENMLPQLAGQYRATLADIAGLPPARKVAGKDDLKERRAQRVAANRGAASKAVASSRGKGVKRGG